jgi:hypothetical protein
MAVRLDLTAEPLTLGYGGTTTVSEVECEAFVKMLARAANTLLTADIYKLPDSYRGLQARCCEIASEIGGLLEQVAR